MSYNQHKTWKLYVSILPTRSSGVPLKSFVTFISFILPHYFSSLKFTRVVRRVIIYRVYIPFSVIRVVIIYKVSMPFSVKWVVIIYRVSMPFLVIRGVIIYRVFINYHKGCERGNYIQGVVHTIFTRFMGGMIYIQGVHIISQCLWKG